ncbi:DUF4157 domain-containing protein [Vibrio variabilis]|uniref:eCIS core domain-containing protein n=1 Tax=Vibrio variabilis TaxID=990271 RepID=UPI001EFA16C3|nr:DUF4157 domain-containing protein [Vibrio variabilis]
MSTHPELAQRKPSQRTLTLSESRRGGDRQALQLQDNRSDVATHQRLNMVRQQQSEASIQKQAKLPSSSNQTGLPHQLKAGIENLSGYSMDDVKVHYNSSKPAQLQAHAYAQGTNIHIGPGQERHLAHEAWHVVQQKQGRVKPTMQMKGKVNVNDDALLEREADVMGAKALQMGPSSHQPHQLKAANVSTTVQAKLSSAVLNVAGETHDEYTQKGNEGLRDKEKAFASQKAGGSYWTESQFKVTESSVWYGKNKGESGDPVRLQFLQGVEVVDSLCGKFLPQLDHTVKDEAKMLRERVESAIRTIGGGVADRYKAMVEEHNSDVRALTDSQIDAAQKTTAKLSEMATQCKAIYDLIQDDGTLNAGSDKIPELKKEAIKINAEIKKQAAVLHGNKAVNQENVRIPRSEAMHYSAQASHASKGIWKVGNNHLNDIEAHIKGFFVGALNTT